jgi:hypothetical protein
MAAASIFNPKSSLKLFDIALTAAPESIIVDTLFSRILKSHLTAVVARDTSILEQAAFGGKLFIMP